MNAIRLAVIASLLAVPISASASEIQGQEEGGGVVLVRVGARTSDGMPDALIRTARALESVDGVEKVEIRAIRGEVRARYQPEKITEETLRSAIDAQGFASKVVTHPMIAKGNEDEVTR